MKKFLLVAALAVGTLTANAQNLTLSTYAGTDLAKYDGQTRNVVVNRYVMNGWNTISLPFAMDAQKVNEVFGADCKLEKLVGVESDGAAITLNFMDCKAEGLKANVPYILHYAGESSVKRIFVENVAVKDADAAVRFYDVNGVQVTFACAQKQRDAKGVYGILARDNGEASFVNVDNLSTTFYATRCYVQLSNGTNAELQTNHLTAGEATSINAVLRGGEKSDVYNLSGTKVASAIDAQSIAELPAGVYVVKGRKVAVR